MMTTNDSISTFHTSMEVKDGGREKMIFQNDKKQANLPENNVDLDENKSIEMEEVKVVGKTLKSLLSCKRMRGFSPHRCPLKDKTFSYVDLL